MYNSKEIEDFQEWATHYNNGFSVLEISAKYFWDAAIIMRGLRAIGINVTEKETPRQKFYRHVIIKEGCWGWKGGFTAGGYPILRVNNRLTKGTRLSYLLHYGVDAGSKYVCHHCDNPVCTNPEHLFLGTAKENMQDCIRKGRRRSKALTVSNVVEIKDLLEQKVSMSKIAAKYGVSESAIYSIRIGKTWKNVLKCST